MPSLFDPARRERILARIDSLTSQSQPRWGRMNVGQMVVHCRRQLQLAMGDIPAQPFSSLAGKFPFKQLFIHVLPTPKGVPTLPEMREPVTGAWEEDRAALKADIERFVRRDPSQPLMRHAAFGDLSRSQWGLLAHKHLDHHLTQFGA